MGSVSDLRMCWMTTWLGRPGKASCGEDWCAGVAASPPVGLSGKCVELEEIAETVAGNSNVEGLCARGCVVAFFRRLLRGQKKAN
mmetsp:Transcript_593/g.1987  ORF Transcript_593/g.1987 Transcript_593/m.1987 type:complete len:85 (+) Transcript_593:436-690(+)